VIAVDGLGEVGRHGGVELEPVVALRNGVTPRRNFGLGVALAAVNGGLAKRIVPAKVIYVRTFGYMLESV
jgi:hypothetical protein